MLDIRGAKILIMGLGTHEGGRSMAAYFASHGAQVTVTDLRRKKDLALPLASLKKYQSIKYVLGKHEARDFRTHDLIIQNPAVPNTSRYLAIARKKGIPITNEAAFFMERCVATVVGITGTRGKSTVSSMVHALLATIPGKKVFLAGNIGTTGLASVLDMAKTPDIVVAELSSWQLEHLATVQRSPQVALVTNVYPDHLNRYSSYRAYQNAKENIFQFQRTTDKAFFNYDNVITRRMERISPGNTYFFSTQDAVRGAYISNGVVYWNDGKTVQTLFPWDASLQRIIPFVENALAAIAIARQFDITPSAIRRTLLTFKGLQYRLQYIGMRGRAKIMNDSCATAPIAVEKALDACPGEIVLICGGVDKDLPYRNLARHIVQRSAKCIVLPGTASDKLIRELKRLKYRELYPVTSLAAAIHKAFSFANASDYILFSPGAASFNLFENEFDRGEQFTKRIHHALS